MAEGASIAVGTSLWSAALILICVPKELAGWIRAVGLVSAVLFASTACRGFFGEAGLPTDTPLPYIVYPFLVLTLAGWIWTLFKKRIDAREIVLARLRTLRA